MKKIWNGTFTFKSPVLTICLLLCSVLLTACSTSSPNTQFYLLPSAENTRSYASDDNVEINTNQDIIHIAVLPVELPEYLRRTQIFRKKISSTNAEINDYNRWAEDLSSAFQRVLSVSLNNNLDGTNLYVTPQFRGIASEYVINVYVNAFEGDFNSDVVLDAYWTLHNKANTTVTNYFYGTTTAGSSYNSLIEAQSKLIDDMAIQISATLDELSNKNIISK